MANPNLAIEPLFQNGTAAAHRPHEASSALRTPSAEVARLAALHQEAADTARLANLLGRTPAAALFLALAVGFPMALTVVSTPAAAATTWLALMAMGFAAAARAYTRAIRAPFERAALANFSADLTAILTYAGFAWGAGAFLLLPADTGPAMAMAYAILPVGGLVALLRAREPALAFLVPAVMLSAFAMVLRPLPAGVLAAALTVLATVPLVLIALRLDKRPSTLPPFAELPFG